MPGMFCLGQDTRPAQTRLSLVTLLEKKVPSLMSAASIPGLSMAWISDGRVAWSRGFGVRDASTRAPVTESTVFEAASLSKPVFAYAVLKLVDRGVLELDKPLTSYLPAPYIAGDDRVKQITARMVLKHTTGFPNWRPIGKPLTIFFTPGEKFSYSGEGYVYLQKVVERIAGRPTDDVVRELVLEPLGMRSSSYTWIKEYDALSATGHDQLGNAVSKGKPSIANAAASLHTTASDYARFVVAVISGDGLSSELAQEMLRPQVKLDETCTNCLEARPPKLSQTLSWGLGWGLEKSEQGEYFWHWGDNGVFRCFVMASRGSRSGLVLFTNSINGLSIIDEMVRSVFPRAHPAISWIKYDQYDSPMMKFAFAVLRTGAERAIQQFRSARKTNSALPPFPENGVNGLGYQLLRAKRLEDAIRIFQLNVEWYPESWNVYDSLGEAYLAQGDRNLSIKNYRRSVELNPANSAGAQKLKDLESDK